MRSNAYSERIAGARLWLAVLGLCCSVVPASGLTLTAHRGASYDAPENTLAAFNEAWIQNADGIEGDFYLSSDGHVVCIHDSTTERTGDTNLTVSTSTLAELKTVDVGIWKGAEWAGERIPTLQEVIATIPSGKYIQIETKVGVEIVEPIAQILEASSLTDDQIIIICSNQDVATAAKARLPDSRVLWITAVGGAGPTAAEVLSVLQATGADGVGTSANATVVDADYVSTVQANGTYEFNVWTVNTISLALQFAATGLDAITTDRPAYLRTYLWDDTPVDPPVVRWDFDGSVINSGSGGAAYDAVLNNGPVYASTGLVGSGALDMDGVDDYVSVSYTLPDKGSIALWYYVEPYYNYQSIFDNSADQDDWEAWIYADGLLRFMLNTGAYVELDLDSRAGPDHWYHIVVSWDKVDDRLEMFVNGQLADTSTIGASWVDPGATFYLGGGHAGNTEGNGIWDDVRIYTNVLTMSGVWGVYTESPAVYLPLDGNATDQAGGDHSGTVTGNPTYVSGKMGQALDCDGTEDAVSVDYLLQDEGTIAMYYYAQGPWYNYQTIWDNSADPNDWEGWIYNDGRLMARINNAAVVYDLDNLSGPNTWYHIAFTWEKGGDIKLYVDRVLRDTAAITAWVDPGTTFYLGGHAGNTLGNGAWDEVYVYNRALTLAEIQALPEPPTGTLVIIQ